MSGNILLIVYAVFFVAVVVLFVCFFVIVYDLTYIAVVPYLFVVIARIVLVNEELFSYDGHIF